MSKRRNDGAGQHGWTDHSVFGPEIVNDERAGHRS